MIARLSLKALRLSITKTLLFRSQHSDAGLVLNTHDVALRLARYTPTLEHIMAQYQVLNLTCTPRRYWTINRAGGNLIMHESESDHGDDIIGDESMGVGLNAWW